MPDSSGAIVGESTLAGAGVGGVTGLYWGLQAAKVAAPAAAEEMGGDLVLSTMSFFDAASGLSMTGTKLGGVYGGVAGFFVGGYLYMLQNPQPLNQNWQVPYASVAASP